MDKPVINSFQELAETFLAKYDSYLPTAFDESLTLLEKFNKMIQYMNDVGALTNGVVAQWNDVMEWVLSDGIGTNVIDKLNEMVSNGQMASIINNTIFNDLNIKVNGNTSKINGLTELMYYRNISVSTVYDATSKTNYTLTVIPKYDDNGNIIEMRNGYANDIVNSGTEKPRTFARRKKATVVVNCAVYDDTTKLISGLNIDKGVVKNSTLTTGQPKYILAWKTSDRTFKVYPPNTTSATVISGGYDNAVACFIPMIDNGVQVSQAILDSYQETNNTHPRQAIGVKSNGDIIFLSCAGRNKNGEGGMTVYDMIRIFQTLGVQMAYNMDGGGSTSTIVRGIPMVRPDDDNGQTERAVPHFLYFSPVTTNTGLNKDLDSGYGDIGEVMARLQALEQRQFLNNVINADYMQLFSTTPGYDAQGMEIYKDGVKVSKINYNDDFFSYYDYINNRSMIRVDSDGTLTTPKGRIGAYLYQQKVPTDLNTITESGSYWATASVPGNPNGTNSWIVEHFIYDGGNTNALQRATKFDDTFQRMHRRKSNGVWGSWV